MKLAYLDLAGPDGLPAVVLHREAATASDPTVAAVRATGLVGRVVHPFGGYAYYPSGMEAGGTCWYRMLPGHPGTDPVSLATAVVQVCDLLDDLALDRPMVVGYGQGAVVALGAGLWRPDRVGSLVAVDPWPGHVALLPPAPRADAARQAAAPPVLLAGLAPGAASDLARVAEELARRGAAAGTWYAPGAGTGGAGTGAADAALPEAVRDWQVSIGAGTTR